MIAFIPLATGQTISNEVLKSLLAQDLDIDIIPCVTDGVIKSNANECRGPERIRKTICEVNSRNQINKILKLIDYVLPYVIIQDRDIIHLFNDNYKRCISFLDINKDYAGIAVPKQMSSHIKHQACVFRTEFMRDYIWNLDEFKHHICPNLLHGVEKTGMKYGYLTDKNQLISEMG